MFCSKCGKETDDKFSYCIYCGNAIVKPAEQTNGGEATPPPTYSPPVYSAPDHNATNGGAYSGYSADPNMAQYSKLEYLEKESTPLLVFSILALALPLGVNIVFAIIAAVKAGSLSSYQLNFSDPFLAERYRSAMAKVRTSKTLVKIAFIISAVSVAITSLIYIAYFFLYFFMFMAI